MRNSYLRLLFQQQQQNDKDQLTERLTERKKVISRPYALGSVKHMVYKLFQKKKKKKSAIFTCWVGN